MTAFLPQAVRAKMPLHVSTRMPVIAAPSGAAIMTLTLSFGIIAVLDRYRIISFAMDSLSGRDAR
jgi:hypothetical protein